MTSKVTFGRLVGVGLLVAALGSGTAVASNTAQGLKADGLRLQGIADAYASQSGSTQQGLKADGLRLQGMAQFYERSLNGSTAQGLKAEGLRLQAMAHAYQRPAASFYTPRALRAEAMRWEAMAQAYREHNTTSAGPSSSSGNGFTWSAAFIGAASMLGFAAIGVVLLIGAGRVGRTEVAV